MSYCNLTWNPLFYHNFIVIIGDFTFRVPTFKSKCNWKVYGNPENQKFTSYYSYSTSKTYISEFCYSGFPNLVCQGTHIFLGC